jgi:two-component system response regulator (stage 0 sporulation protein A)
MKENVSVIGDGKPRQSILIIDDDKEWTDLLRLYFVEKYEVQVVNSACEAMETISKQRPNLIIVDLVMPMIDGFGIIRRLNDSEHERIPAILLTGWNNAEVKECAESVGCAAVLSKPIEMKALDETISSVISQKLLMSTAVM